MSSITINIINGTPPYAVEIQPGDVFMSFPTGGTKIINDLSEGEYTIILTDNVGCEDDANVSLQTTTTTTTLEPTTTTTSSTTTTTTTQFTPVEYGALYNWYAATDGRYIANSGWHVPTHAELQVLDTYLGGYYVSGGHCKESGTTYWLSASAGADNSSGFNGKGAGLRNDTSGTFDSLTFLQRIWSSTSEVWMVSTAWMMSLDYNSDIMTNTYQERTIGYSGRILKDSTSLTDGQIGTYIGNDGKVYPTICIGTQEWLACNLNETKFRNGDWIHGYELGTYTPITNANWAALTSEGMSYYNDLESNG